MAKDGTKGNANGVSDEDIIITKKQLKTMVPYSGVHISRLERVGKFPKRLQLGENRVGWILAEVRAWIGSRKASRVSADTEGDALGHDLPQPHGNPAETVRPRP